MEAWSPRRTHLTIATGLCTVGTILTVAPPATDLLEYPVERTGEYVASITDSPFVSPVPSAALHSAGAETPEVLRPFTIGRTPGTEGGGYTWNGEEVPAQNLYGFRISEPGGADEDKPVIVLISGQHPVESHSIFTLEGTIDVLLDPDHPVGRILRSRADFYIYPQVNPEGRWSRTGRSNPQNPGQDSNRVWSDPGGWTNVEVVRNAMYQDLEGRDVRYFYDYHAPGHTSSSLFHYATPQSARSPWAQFSENGGINIVLAGGGPRLAYGWSMMSWENGGLGADYGFTPEIGRQDQDEPAAYRKVGEEMALAMARALLAEELDGPPPAGVDLRFDFGNGQVPDADGWNVIATDLGGITVPLIDREGEVTAVRFTIPDDLESSGAGQWPAGTPLPEWADRAAGDGYVAFEGDLTLVIENLGRDRAFDVELIRSRRVEEETSVAIRAGEGWTTGVIPGHVTHIRSFENVGTDTDGNLVLEIVAANGEEVGGVINAMRVAERTAAGSR